MAENLRYGGDETHNKSDIQSVCPSGWHVPSSAEWNDLIIAAGGASVSSLALKAKRGWRNNINGNDDFGFMALPYSDGWGSILGTGGLDSKGNSWTPMSCGYGDMWWTTSTKDVTHYNYDKTQSVVTTISILGTLVGLSDPNNLCSVSQSAVRCVKN